MISKDCKVRSGHPVPITVQSHCPEPDPKIGGCPNSAIQRCGQYEKDPCPDITCKSLVPPFYETERQKNQKEEKFGSSCLTLPTPASDNSGMVCAPICKHQTVDDNHSRGNELSSTTCQPVKEEKSPNYNQKQGFSRATDDTRLPCKDEIVHQQCLSSCSPKVASCWQKSLDTRHANNTSHENHGRVNDNFKGNEIGCYGYKKSEVGSPGHGSHDERSEKNEPVGCSKSQIPPCWQDMFDIAPKRTEECHTIPRHKCDTRDGISRTPVSNHERFSQCSPGSVSEFPERSVTDNRGALRPDVRECPALGRNFCVHEPVPLQDQRTKLPSECDSPAFRLLPNIDSLKKQGKDASENRHYCVPSDYNNDYCGRSGTNFSMYCAASSGVQMPPPDCTGPKKREKKGPPHCPSREPCCMQQPTTFVVERDSCYGQQCVSSDPPDRDVARRVGGFKPNMPSPTTWI